MRVCVCVKAHARATLTEYGFLSLLVAFLFVIKFCHIWGLPAKCPCINILIQLFFKGRKQDLRGEQSGWGEGVYFTGLT